MAHHSYTKGCDCTDCGTRRRQLAFILANKPAPQPPRNTSLDWVLWKSRDRS